MHATQFFEFARSIGDAAARDNLIHLSQASVQPIAGDDVAAAVVQTASGEPTMSTTEFAGPEVFAMTDLVQLELRSRKDSRQGVADPLARYFGNALTPDELLPGADAFRFTTRFEDWLQQQLEDEQ